MIYDDGIISLKPKEINLLVNKINRQKCDWVIFQYNGYSYNRFGAPSWLAKLFKKITTLSDTKLCLIVHETFIREDKGLKLKIYRILQRQALKAATKYSNLILTTTHLYQSQLDNLNRKSHLFFTPSNFENSIKELSIQKPEHEELILGTFGNRNPDFLIKVLEELERKKLHFKFYFIGNYQPIYTKLIKDATNRFTYIQISRSGKLTDRNIVNYLIQLDAFILLEPVRSDNGGGLNTKSGSSATALCMGIPIFSTKGDFTNSHVFKENENYLLLDYKDYKNSANIIYEILQNKEHLKQIGHRGQKLYHEQFSWSQYLNKMLKLILDVEAKKSLK